MDFNVDLLKNMVSSVSSTQMALNDLFIITHKNAPKGSFTYNTWITEEYKEFMAEKDHTPEQYKELLDLIWVCFQKANEQGYDISKGLQALVDEYTSKFYTVEGEYQPLYREDGKLLKNTGFKKADFSKIME